MFVAGTPIPDMVDAFNTLIRDPLTYLLDPPTFRARRTGALNVTEGRHQFIPWDTVDEDSASGWTSPVAGAATTLNGATAVNATTATLTSAVGFATGQIVRFETGANVEYRTIALAGSVITVSALNLAHASLSSVTVVSSDPTQYIAQAPGWYMATATISLSGTGAAALVLTPSVAVNGASNTGIGTSGGQRGTSTYPPVGVAGQPKIGQPAYEVYCNVGDIVQLDHVFSTESAITAVDTTAGLQCSLELVWTGL
jgi:hypothetical protein